MKRKISAMHIAALILYYFYANAWIGLTIYALSWLALRCTFFVNDQKQLAQVAFFVTVPIVAFVGILVATAFVRALFFNLRKCNDAKSV